MMDAEPDYEAALGLIKYLSSAELRELMNDNAKIEDLLKDLPQIKNLHLEKEKLLTFNKSLAEDNLSLEPKLAEEKQNLISKYEESSNTQEEINKMKQEIDKSSIKESPESIQGLIKKSAQEREDESEKLVDNFLTNSPSVEEFLEEFVALRVLTHLTKIKADKVAELVSRNRSSSQSSLFQPPVITSSYGTPYPPQLPNMPMPNSMNLSYT